MVQICAKRVDSMIPQLAEAPDSPFPPLSSAEDEIDGLLAWGGDLHPKRLLNAYSQGIFPWYSPGQPILWWWPQPRTVIYPQEFHLSRRLRRSLRKNNYSISADSDFKAVITQCARPANEPDLTWIDAAMIHAFCEMHTLGYAHSVEVWEKDELVGGIYGISLGLVFFGESMFSTRRDASKIALAWLCQKMADTGFKLLDCQMPNEHLNQFGARDLPGPDFINLLENTRLDNPIPDWGKEFARPVEW